MPRRSPSHAVAVAAGFVACLGVSISLWVSACSTGPSPVPPWAAAAAASATGPVVLPQPPLTDAAMPPPATDAMTMTDTGAAMPPVTDASADAGSDASGDAELGDGGVPTDGSKLSAETWTEFFTSYLAPGTVGNCMSCHAQADTPSDTFTYLETSYMPTDFAMAFTWSGGPMPLNGPKSNPAAVAALSAWVAAGAQNN